MKPGQELDALIHEKVFGLKVNKKRIGQNEFEMTAHIDTLPKYSSEMSVAWKVKTKAGITTIVSDGIGNVIAYIGDQGEGNFAGGETEPHAICLAALKAMGVEIK